MTHRTRTRIRAGLAAAMTVAATLALGGCAGVAGSGGPAEITFLLSKPEAIPYFKDVVSRFNSEQSDVHVTLDQATNLSAGFLRGSPPDVGLLNYNMEMARFMERGALSDLSDLPVAKRIRPDVQELVNQYATYPGRTSVLPYSVAGASVIYNKQIFADNGIEVPTTWDELIAACEKLLDQNITPIYSTFKEPWTIAQGAFDYTVGGSLDVAGFYKKLNAQGTDVGPDSPVSFQKDFAAPVDLMNELLTYTNADAAGKSYGDGNVAFAKGEAAMYLQGPWALGEIAKTAPDLQLGTFPLPVTNDPEDRKVRVNIDLALWIPDVGTDKVSARKFAEYLTQQDVMDAYNKAFLGFGTTTDAAPAEDPRLLGMQDYYVNGQFYQGASQAIPLTIPAANYIQSIATGADPHSTLAQLDADWARVAFRG